MCDCVSHGSADCPLAPSSASSPELAVQLLRPSRSGGRSTRRGLRTSVQTKWACVFSERCKFRHMCAECGGGHCAKTHEIVVVEAAPRLCRHLVTLLHLPVYVSPISIPSLLQLCVSVRQRDCFFHPPGVTCSWSKFTLVRYLVTGLS